MAIVTLSHCEEMTADRQTFRDDMPSLDTMSYRAILIFGLREFSNSWAKMHQGFGITTRSNRKWTVSFFLFLDLLKLVVPLLLSN